MERYAYKKGRGGERRRADGRGGEERARRDVMPILPEQTSSYPDVVLLLMRHIMTAAHKQKLSATEGYQEATQRNTS